MATADTVRDRHQAREERGVRSTASVRGGGGDRTPAPPRERKPALAALAVLLIVGGAAIAGLLAIRMDDRVPVVVAARDIPLGAEITQDMLTTTQVASDLDTLVPESQMSQLVGKQATKQVFAGELITAPVLYERAGGWLVEGNVAVGASLAPGRMPATGLEMGDIVKLVRVVDGSGEVLVEEARVSRRSGGDDTGSSPTVVTFIVTPEQAPKVAGVAANGELAAVLVSRGEPLESEE